MPIRSFVEIAGPLFLLSPSGEISPKKKKITWETLAKGQVGLET